MLVLAGDIGGTSARIALIDVGAGLLTMRAEQDYPSAEHVGLETILADFAHTHPLEYSAATFGVAGPVQDGRVQASNLPWTIDARALARQLGLPRVGLINDLTATALGIAELGERDLHVLNAGAPVAASNAAVLAAGTGLGEVGLFWDGVRHQPVASEGGHADFAPRTELEIALLVHLTERYGRVSYERVLSGPGLVNIYEFLRDSGRRWDHPLVAERMKEIGAAPAITEAALAHTCELCEQTLALFVSSYGAEAGNLALRYLAGHGVYLAGGIAPRILPALQRPEFLQAFTAKGRLSPLVAAMPVRVVLNERVGLLGAARHAALQQQAALPE